jgi:hypothetical protein
MSRFSSTSLATSLQRRRRVVGVVAVDHHVDVVAAASLKQGTMTAI